MTGRSISNCNIGTLCYSSPEVVKNEEYDYRTDIWSLGCIIYELCTYTMLFNSSNERALIDKICTQKPPELPNNYSKEMNKICQICLAKDKEQRPSARELLGSESKNHESLISLVI